MWKNVYGEGTFNILCVFPLQGACVNAITVRYKEQLQFFYVIAIPTMLMYLCVPRGSKDGKCRILDDILTSEIIYK